MSTGYMAAVADRRTARELPNLSDRQIKQRSVLQQAADEIVQVKTKSNGDSCKRRSVQRRFIR